ncbi:hypothetical protein H3H36_16970 [Duganella sp. FT3S]|uniref:Tle cognate immunity protein 4 C-terminal domain-containing protein n=1 Tax=Rugamonas fusca TaxID=2758568 RepID=A0A7W2I7X4_9BURK|nr:T6SS immunity protein Tli4 family protein [Rugamonas fusca]MBA5607052.1 hypothetical protein [Rugamonas fusca]
MQRTAGIGFVISVFFLSLGACAKDVAMKNTTTLCFGRFLIDLPPGAQIKEIGQQSQFMYGDLLSEVFQGGVAEFGKRMMQRETKLRSVTGKNERLLDKTLSPSQDAMIFTTREKVFGENDFGFEAYKVDQDQLFSLMHINFDEGVFRNKVLIRLQNEILPYLRARSIEEIPVEPGFCVKNGFIANDGSRYQFEEARMQINFKEWPDVWVSIYSQTVPKGGEQTLLQRVASHPYTGIYATLARQIKTLRKGVHDIHGIKGEEILEVFPTENGFKQHSFRWETLGAVKSIFAPSIVFEFESGTPLEGEPRPPTLTDDQAVKLFDSIVNSIRLRPTTAPAKSNANERPKRPLGDQAVTGRICPQTGWWQTDDAGVVADWRRRHFKEGEPLPSALRYLEPNLWQKIKGERPAGQGAVLWKLVEYGDAPEVAKQELPPQEAGPAKGAEPPTGG